jgi:hypothetical protein
MARSALSLARNRSSGDMFINMATNASSTPHRSSLLVIFCLALPKKRQHLFRILRETSPPINALCPKKGALLTPRHILHNPGPHRLQMEVRRQLYQISGLLTTDRFITVLTGVNMSEMSPAGSHGVTIRLREFYLKLLTFHPMPRTMRA